mgnify:CR=1 FL=1
MSAGQPSVTTFQQKVYDATKRIAKGSGTTVQDVNSFIKQYLEMKKMMKKIVTKRHLRDPALRKADLSYWMSRPSEERVATVDYLRRQVYGSPARLQRTARVTQLPLG